MSHLCRWNLTTILGTESPSWTLYCWELATGTGVPPLLATGWDGVVLSSGRSETLAMGDGEPVATEAVFPRPRKVGRATTAPRIRATPMAEKMRGFMVCRFSWPRSRGKLYGLGAFSQEGWLGTLRFNTAGGTLSGASGPVGVCQAPAPVRVLAGNSGRRTFSWESGATGGSDSTPSLAGGRLSVGSISSSRFTVHPRRAGTATGSRGLVSVGPCLTDNDLRNADGPPVVARTNGQARPQISEGKPPTCLPRSTSTWPTVRPRPAYQESTPYGTEGAADGGDIWPGPGMLRVSPITIWLRSAIRGFASSSSHTWRLRSAAIFCRLSPGLTMYSSKVAAGVGPALLDAEGAVLGVTPQTSGLPTAGTMLQPGEGARAGVSDGATVLPAPSDP